MITEPTISDVDAIASLHAKSWQIHYRGALSDDFLDNKVLQDRTKVWFERFNRPAADQFIRMVRVDGTIVAFMCAYFNESGQFGTLLDNLHVLPDMKGRGFGTALIGSLAQAIVARQLTGGMYLWVLQQNTKAIGFYKSLGGLHTETVTENGMGDSTITKLRFYWHSVNILLP